jgi:hypothetical protein
VVTVDASKSKNRPRPSDGEVFLHCGHVLQEHSVTGEVRVAPGSHYFQFPKGMRFRRFRVISAISSLVPDEDGEARWLVACEECFRAADGQARKIEPRGHGEWRFGEFNYRKED